jgi:hypothetical protein
MVSATMFDEWKKSQKIYKRQAKEKIEQRKEMEEKERFSML